MFLHMNNVGFVMMWLIYLHATKRDVWAMWNAHRVGTNIVWVLYSVTACSGLSFIGLKDSSHISENRST